MKTSDSDESFNVMVDVFASWCQGDVSDKFMEESIMTYFLLQRGINANQLPDLYSALDTNSMHCIHCGMSS